MGLMGKVKRNFGQFVKFGVVGGSGVIVNLIVTYIMTQLHGGVSRDNEVVFQFSDQFALRYTIVVWVGAFMVANVWNYQLNRSWTFKEVHHRSWWAEFWPFFAVGLVAAFAGIFIKWALTNPTSPVYLPDPPFNDESGIRARAYWSQLFTIIITMPINYVVNKIWTFRGKKKEAPEVVETIRAGGGVSDIDSSENDVRDIDSEASDDPEASDEAPETNRNEPEEHARNQNPAEGMAQEA